MNFRRIIAVIEPDKQQQKSLSRAIEIASLTQSTVTAFMTIYDVSYEMTSMLSSDEREKMRHAVLENRANWLIKLVEEHYQNNTVSIDVKVVWHNRPYESIICEVLEQGYDLIVKGTQDHDTLSSIIFTPTDWHIMRKAPVPVLLVKEHAWPENGKMIAAVNVGSEDKAHVSLNQQITKHALDLAKLLNSEVHLVNSYPGTPANIVIEIPEFNPAQYDQASEQHHIKSMNNLAQQFDILVQHCHVDMGLPEDVIPQRAVELDAGLVIIGTVGRHGISATLIGNTAEHVIDKLNCDILAIKPDDFECPIKI